MFWTAADVFKLRLEQKRFYEATKIFQALRRVLPNIDDKDGHAAGFMRFAGSQLGQLRRDRATAPAGSPASFSPLHFSGESALAPAGSPASSGSLHFSGESVTAPAGSPAVPPAASIVLSGSPAEMCSPVKATVPAGSPEGLNPGQRAVLDCIKANEGIKVPKLSELTIIPSKSIERHIKVLIERNLIEHRGSKKTGGYYAKQ